MVELLQSAALQGEMLEPTAKAISLQSRSRHKTKSELTSTTINLSQKQLAYQRVNETNAVDSTRVFDGSETSKKAEIIHNSEKTKTTHRTSPTIFGLEKNSKIWRSRSVPSQSEMTENSQDKAERDVHTLEEEIARLHLFDHVFGDDCELFQQKVLEDKLRLKVCL